MIAGQLLHRVSKLATVQEWADTNLVNRAFRADAPSRLRVSDVTYVPTDEGFLYVATVLDAFSRRVVGWSMSDRLYTELVLRALDMAAVIRPTLR